MRIQIARTLNQGAGKTRARFSVIWGGGGLKCLPLIVHGCYSNEYVDQQGRKRPRFLDKEHHKRGCGARQNGLEPTNW